MNSYSVQEIFGYMTDLNVELAEYGNDPLPVDFLEHKAEYIYEVIIAPYIVSSNRENFKLITELNETKCEVHVNVIPIQMFLGSNADFSARFVITTSNEYFHITYFPNNDGHLRVYYITDDSDNMVSGGFGSRGDKVLRVNRDD